MGRKLYVGNLPYTASEDELRELFGRAGGVDTVNVVRDNATGRARGFAFVEMVSDADAQKAITEINGTQMGGRTLAINEARPKLAFGGGGGGGWTRWRWIRWRWRRRTRRQGSNRGGREPRW
jgi:RNA recognition motif-containing protein